MLENQQQPTSAEEKNPNHDQDFVIFLKESNLELYNYIKDNPSAHYQALLENKMTIEELKEISKTDPAGGKTSAATKALIAFRASSKT